ncbi:MAG: hypothetical protein HYX47_14415 [Burkholderiales bacterium]|nr:hypothetical protein [Burkholderiales bacterium]
MPTVTGPLLGSWYAPNPGGGTDQIVFTFLADGTFLVADKGTQSRDPTGQSGIEWGSYTWTESSGAFGATAQVNTDGQWGLSNSGMNSMRVSGDTLTLAGTQGSMTATRTPAVAGALAGSWYAPNPGGGTDQIVFTFLADGTFLVADKGTTARDPTGQSGLEWGTYTWNSTTGALALSVQVNTDGQWGLSNTGSLRAQVSGSTLTLTTGEGVMTIQRVPVGSATVAVTTGITLTGSAAADTLAGSALADTFTGLGGNDVIDGGTGIDTAIYSTARANYSITRTSSGFSVANPSGTEGTDTLSNMERLRFSDQSVALDMGVAQAAGQTQLLLGAVLGRALLATKTPLLGTVIGLFDQGFTIADLSGALMRLDIWGLLANGGAASATNQQIANYLLTTVNGSAPDAATLASATASINTGVQGAFLAQLAVSAANQTQVGLVGLADTGLVYTL